MITAFKYRYKPVWRILWLFLYISLAYSEVDTTLLINKCEKLGNSSTVGSELAFIADDDDICDGHFQLESPLVYQKDVVFRADESNINAKTGESYLQGSTKVAYKNSALLADKVCLFRQGHKSIAVVKGSAKFKHSEAVILADSILWDLKRYAYLQDAKFNIPMPNTNLRFAWGLAESIELDDNNIELVDSSYSICSPKHPIWQLDVGSLVLDRKAHQGHANNAIFRLYGLPVFYLPVFYFPLSHDRSSGFLYPTITYSNIGTILKVPYYFNLASNYDSLVTASYYGKRGFAINNDSRFLTSKSSGFLHALLLPGDKEFNSFKTDFADTYALSKDPGEISQAASLLDAKNKRGFFYYEQQYKPFDNITLSAKYTWLSDDYMRDDFEEVRSLLLNRKAPRSLHATFNFESLWASFDWKDDHILQPLGKTILKGLFNTMPDFYMRHNIYNSGTWNVGHKFQILGFEPATMIDLANDFDIKGTRVLYEPSVEYDSYNLHAKLGLHSSSYHIEDSDSEKIFIPWFNIERKWSFTNGKSLITSPRVLLKYAPFKDQDSLPILDASYSFPNYNRLFSMNRFTGFDRFGDTSSFVFGLENKIISPVNGLVKARFNVAKSYEMRLHRVCLGSCVLDEQAQNHWSDWVFAANYFSDNATWSLDWNVANSFDQTKNLYLSLDLKASSRAYYHYTKLLDGYDSEIITNKVLGIEHEIYLNKRWSAFGNVEHDTSGNHFFNYLAGLKYTSCCLGFKLGLKRHYSGVNGYGKSQYDNSVMFEFSLPGFGGSS